MRLISVLLTASLAANLALVAALRFRSSTPPPLSPPPGKPSHVSADAATDAQKTAALIAALASGDSGALIAAGVPLEVVRQLTAARAFSRLATLSRSLERPPQTDAYWRSSRALRPLPTREQRTEHSAAEREFDLAMRDAFGHGWNEDWRGGRYGFLPADRQEQIRRIERDYDDIQREISADSEDVQLPADREKLKLLKIEMDRDINAALTPAEREQVELRSSPSARFIIDQYGDILASEDEYKRLYALRKAFDDRFNVVDDPPQPRTPEDNRVREEAERKLNDELRAAMGESRWATMSRANDVEYRALGTLSTRLGLPAGTPDGVYLVRDFYAAQSLAIQGNPALADADRHKQLTDLATQAKAELRAKLGADGEDAYSRQFGWVQLLQSGSAFITNPRLLPPGSARPGGESTFYALPPPTPSTPAPKH